MSGMNQERFESTFIVEGRDLEALRYQAELTYERKVDELRRASVNLIDRMQRNLRSLDEYGRSDNELGVLQGSGMEFDRLCGEVTVAQRNLEAVHRLIESVEVQ